MYEQQNTYVMFHRIKTILLINDSYNNDTNKLFKTTLVTISYNLYRLLCYIYLCILTKMFDMFILIVQP